MLSCCQLVPLQISAFCSILRLIDQSSTFCRLCSTYSCNNHQYQLVSLKTINHLLAHCTPGPLFLFYSYPFSSPHKQDSSPHITYQQKRDLRGLPSLVYSTSHSQHFIFCLCINTCHHSVNFLVSTAVALIVWLNHSYSTWVLKLVTTIRLPQLFA